MSKTKAKSNNLPPLQKSIVSCLAKHGLQTINGTMIKLSGHYKATWTAFKSLEKKGLIEKVNDKHKEYRGRKYPQFWLTERGIASALLHNANPYLLLENIKKAHPNDSEKASLVEVLSQFDPELRKMMLQMVMRESDIGSHGIVALIMLGLGKGLNAEIVNSKMVPVLRKYPREFRFYRQGLRRSYKQLKRLINSLPKNDF